MEALTLVLDGLVMLLVVYMGLLDDRRPADVKLTSLFRMTEGGAQRTDDAVGERRRHIATSRDARSRF